MAKELSAYDIIRISHTDSTAIDSICAKPIVDILAKFAPSEDILAVAGTASNCRFIKTSESEKRI